MGTILYIGTFGSDDPTRATMPVLGAVGALKKGHQPSIVFMGEAVMLMREGVVDAIRGVGFPPLKELMGQILEAKVPIHV